MRQRVLALLLLLLPALLPAPALAADKLRTFYSGSGGISAEVHRVVIIEFADDGSALVQQTWHGKDPQSWNANYTRAKNTITLTFEVPRDAAPGTKALDPLVMTFKHGTLTPTSWDTTALGALGPPKLSPFSGSSPRPASVRTCHTMDSVNPAHNCVTWDSRQ